MLANKHLLPTHISIDQGASLNSAAESGERRVSPSLCALQPTHNIHTQGGRRRRWKVDVCVAALERVCL